MFYCVALGTIDFHFYKRKSFYAIRFSCILNINCNGIRNRVRCTRNFVIIIFPKTVLYCTFYIFYINEYSTQNNRVYFINTTCSFLSHSIKN